MDEAWGWNPHILYHSVQNILLQGHAFGLKNAGATYQRLVTHVFKPKLGRNMDTYVNGMIIKSKHPYDHLKNLSETFDGLWFFDMRLNPVKYVFGIASSKFLSYLISQRGIEANLDKVQAILGM